MTIMRPPRSRAGGPLITPEEALRRYHRGPRSGVFTDGSCEGNPGPGGWGFVWVQDDHVILERCGYAPATTNNRMELTALIQAYRALPPEVRVSVYSDSQLCVNTVNLWAAAWEKRGWKRKGGPIANLELVQELYRLVGEHPHARLQWIRAHDGSRWNEYVDTLATTYLRERS